MPEGEEEEQEMENLFEKIMKGNRLPGSLGSSRVPKNLDQGKHTTRYIISTLPKIKDKERTLKSARENETVTYLQRSSHKTIN